MLFKCLAVNNSGLVHFFRNLGKQYSKNGRVGYRCEGVVLQQIAAIDIYSDFVLEVGLSQSLKKKGIHAVVSII